VEVIKDINHRSIVSPTMMMTNLFSLTLLLLSAVPVAGTGSSSSSPFLKEILTGRCYDKSPTGSGDTEDCSAIVGSLMNAFESHLDSEILPSSFEAYVKRANFSSPKDHAIFFLKFFGDIKTQKNPFVPLPGFVTPEDTPGGSLMRDLVFCGVDQRENCSVEKSNAFWSFWQAAYAEYASRVTGHLEIVLENEYSDVEFLIRSVVPQLKASAVDSVTLYDGGRNCGDERILKLQTALAEEAGMDTDKVACKNFELEQFYSDNLQDSRAGTEDDRAKNTPATNGGSHEETSSEQDETADEKTHHCGKGFVLFLVLGTVALCYASPFKKKVGYGDMDYYSREGSDEKRMRDLVEEQYQRAQQHLLACLGHTPLQNNEENKRLDEEVADAASEVSPLTNHTYAVTQ